MKTAFEEQYTMDQVAALMNWSRRTVQRRMKDDVFRPRPWNDKGTWRISASALHNYVEKRRISGKG